MNSRDSAASWDYWTQTRGWRAPPQLTVAELDWLRRIDAAPDFFKLSTVVAEMREAMAPAVDLHVQAADLPEHAPEMPWRTRSYLILRGEVERRLTQIRGDTRSGDGTERLFTGALAALRADVLDDAADSMVLDEGLLVARGT